MRSKNKYKVGNLVRCSSRLTEGACVAWERRTNGDYGEYPVKYTYFRKMGIDRVELLKHSVGFITKKFYVKRWGMHYYEVKFMPRNITLFLPEPHLKQAKTETNKKEK